MYSLRFLFLALPLYFSHIFMHFGWIIGGGASFERQKMYLFLIIALVALIELIMTRYDDISKNIRGKLCIMAGLIALPWVSVLIYGTDIDIYWLRGSYEKFHGYLFYIGVILLGYTLTLITQGEKQILIRWSLISAGIVSVIALIEATGVGVFLSPRTDAWGAGVRTISTLGNPNYLAGYLLIMLPLISYIRQPERYILASLIVLAILSTMSYIALVLLVLYGVWIVTRILTAKYQLSHIVAYIVTLVVLILGLILGYSLIPPEKLLSLTSRFVLMYEVARETLRYPIGLVTGYGPEAVMRFFIESRSEVVSAYFPSASLIDSSHNILIDIVFQYGIIPLIVLGWYIRRQWNIWDISARTSWILGLAFLSMNPYVVTHLALLTLTLTVHDKR